MNTEWHFPVMIGAALVVFVLLLRLLLSKRGQVAGLAPVVVVGRMLFGKYGLLLGLPWWLYYPIPMLVTVLLPPWVLQLSGRRTAAYLVLSFLSAPFIHVLFSFLLGWPEYMPFWKIPAASNFFGWTRASAAGQTCILPSC